MSLRDILLKTLRHYLNVKTLFAYQVVVALFVLFF